MPSWCTSISFILLAVGSITHKTHKQPSEVREGHIGEGWHGGVRVPRAHGEEDVLRSLKGSYRA